MVELVKVRRGEEGGRKQHEGGRRGYVKSIVELFKVGRGEEGGRKL